MIGTFSTYLKEKKPLLKEVIRRLRKDYPFVSVLATDVVGTRISVDQTSTNVGPSGLSEAGFVFKVYDGDFYTEYATDRLTADTVEHTLAKIRTLVETNKTLKTVNAPLLSEDELTKTYQRPNRGSVMTTDAIVDHLKRLVTSTLASNDKLINVKAAVETNETSKLYLSAKKDLEQYYTWTNTNAFALAREKTNTKYGYESRGDDSLEAALAVLPNTLATAADVAVKLLDSKPPQPGVYTVITDPSITGLIAHEAFGHGVEMDMFVKDRALAQAYIDHPVANEKITMHDGAAAVKSAASYFFDDDGVLAQDTKIIERGVLKRGISDALSALQLRTEPTGNGRRESFRRKSYTRMTNTFFEPGHDKLDAMIASVKHGYLLVETNNGMEDPKNWGIQCTAHYGREIKDGQFTGTLVSPVVLSGHVIDLLKSITMVSTDFKIIGSGSCGKGYKEWVRVSDGGPYLKAEVKIG